VVGAQRRVGGDRGGPQKSSRRRSRELALQALYQLELSGTAPQHGVPLLAEHFEADTADLPFARDLAEGAVAHMPEIDAAIAESSEHWSLTRMARVDLAVLRLATYELLHRPDVPTSVVLNEAIELGKRYGTEESGPFVNGVLDRVAKLAGQRRAGRATP
jgi:N utilization substance protein B